MDKKDPILNIEQYLEVQKIELEKVRLRMEEQQNFHERWKLDVVSKEKLNATAAKEALAFAQSALRSCFLLNGGALIAFPAIAKFLQIDPELDNKIIVLPIILFIAGLTASSISNFFTYLALAKNAERNWSDREINALRLNAEHNPKTKPDNYDEVIENLQTTRENENNSSGRFALVALILFVISILSFIGGAGFGASLFL